MYVVNMFGTGIRYWILDIPADLFSQIKKIKNKSNLEYVDLFFDDEFLKFFEINNWEDFHCQKSGRGLYLSVSNSIEIKKGTKRIAKFTGYDLLHSPLMFQPYKIENNPDVLIKPERECVQIAIVQEEIGKFYKFKIETTSFEIDNLVFQKNRFQLNEFLQQEFICNVQYNGNDLLSVKEDVLTQKNKLFFL